MDLSINDQQYRTGKLSAFTQLHILRRLTPCIGKLTGLADGVKTGGFTVARDDSGAVTDVDGDLSAVLTPLAEAVTCLSDEDVEYVCNACLEVTERRQSGGGWAPMRVKGATMYEVSLPVMLRIAWAVIKDNLEDFSAALPSATREGLQGLLSRG